MTPGCIHVPRCCILVDTPLAHYVNVLDRGAPFSHYAHPFRRIHPHALMAPIAQK